MSNEGTSRTASATRAEGQTEESVVGRLAQFFPGAMGIRIPITVTVVPNFEMQASSKRTAAQSLKPAAKRNGNGAPELSENAVIEYGTAQEVLFASALPLEFEDRVRLETDDGSLRAEAHVVAVQYHDGRMAVAVRFSREISNWIIKR